MVVFSRDLLTVRKVQNAASIILFVCSLSLPSSLSDVPSSDVVQWTGAAIFKQAQPLSPCNPSSTQRGSSAHCSRLILTLPHPWKSAEIWINVGWPVASNVDRSPWFAWVARVVIPTALGGCSNWLRNGKGGSEAGLGSDHLPISTCGTAPTQGLRQQRARADQWIIQTREAAAR